MWWHPDRGRHGSEGVGREQEECPRDRDRRSEGERDPERREGDVIPHDVPLLGKRERDRRGVQHGCEHRDQDEMRPMERGIDRDRCGERRSDDHGPTRERMLSQRRDRHGTGDSHDHGQPQLDRQLRKRDRGDVGPGHPDEAQQHERRPRAGGHCHDTAKRLALRRPCLSALVSPRHEWVEAGEERGTDRAGQHHAGAYRRGEDRVEAVRRAAGSGEQERGEHEEFDAHREIRGDARRCRERCHGDRPEHRECREDAEHDARGNEVLGHRQGDEHQAHRQQRSGQQRVAARHAPGAEERGHGVCRAHADTDRGDAIEAV